MIAIKLLLVDDEVLIVDMLKDALEDGGFDVTTADTGDAALQILAEDDAVAGLITDVNMGSGADGWAVATAAREANPDLPVVYMTGGAGNEWASRGVPKSVLVTKPFAAAQILTAIATLLNTPDTI